MFALHLLWEWRVGPDEQSVEPLSRSLVEVVEDVAPDVSTDLLDGLADAEAPPDKVDIADA